MTPVDIPGTRVIGKRWEFLITVTDTSKAAKDLTGSTVTLALGLAPGHKLVDKQATLSDQGTDKGKATVVFTPEDTRTLPISHTGRMYFQVDVSYDSANVDTVAAGSFAVQSSML